MAEMLHVDTKLNSLTIEELHINSDTGAAFAAVFHGDQTIKTLTMRIGAIDASGAVSFVEALPQNHSLEVIKFGYNRFDNESVVSIVRTLCHKRLKGLLLADSREWSGRISQYCCTRIIHTLKENDHSFTKLVLFRDSQDSQWQNKIRLEIDNITWKNRLQVEKYTWVDRFLDQDASTQNLLFCTALERANEVDNKPFSKSPNMLYYLIKESPGVLKECNCTDHSSRGIKRNMSLLYEATQQLL
jgi:hypothetical protein